ncbi:MAG: choice-of-anchor D domain-containing protein, partial [Myxococcota bacterium]|nr:choice-of-anchor D domain-containing protein [Myxococcota bacterium]
MGADGATISFAVAVEAVQLTSEVGMGSTIIAFGPVATGTTATQTVSLLNTGSLEVTLDALSIDGASAGEFSVVTEGALNAVVSAGTQFPIEVSYTPVGQDTDTAALHVVYTAADGQDELVAPLNGREVSAVLVVTPDPLDFGLRSAGQAHVETVTVTSGNPEVSLEVKDVTVEAVGAWSGTITVEEWSEEGVVVGPDESVDVEVTFTPTEDMVSEPTPVASLVFQTNDPTQGGAHVVPVYGQRGGTGLEVFPPDIVYFGYIGVGATVYREVTLYNAGNTPITVANVHAEGGYHVVDGDNWPPSSNTPEPAVLEPGGLQVVTVKYTNTGAPLETTWGKLVILSDDDARPNWEVLLNAQKVEGGECLVQFVPSALDYGLTTPWTQHVQTLQLVNIGSDACAYHSAITDDCAEAEQCEVSSDDAMAPSSSAKYEVTSEPEVGTALEPGQTMTIEVTFSAPEAGPVITPHPGMVRARVTSVSAQTGADVVTVHPSSASWLTIPNLMAEVGVGQLEVTPPEVDFQLVEIGCVSPPTVVTATNVGMAHLELTGWWLDGCPDEVTVLDAPDPDVIHTLQVGTAVTWTLDYAPVDESEDTCTLVVTSSDSLTPTEVPIVGRGAYPAEVVDIFTDSESQKVDVLFVVDDSGSMGQEQANLSDSFQAFIYEAATWDSDYQIGVTTTTVSLFDLSGGALYGSPPWVTEANWEKFVNIVEVGVGGSGTEQGIWAALIATSPPLIDTPEGECEDDTDCGLMLSCVAGKCQGINHGFLRDDAALEIVFVSDEDDQSPEDVEGYLNHFRAIKGFDRPELLHMHAIVGPPGGCSSANGSADAGHRYMNL